MGIPHLITTLERYADYEILENENIVIDGPALAYHILYVCRANGVSHPSYSLLGSAVIAWLDELRTHRVNIQHIYFDGYLPVAKRFVRMERTMKSNAQLNLHFASNSKGYPNARLNEREKLDFDVFTLSKPLAKPSLDPSFLVPAIIDAIRDNPQYQKIFSIIPGEADAYCAKHLSQHGGMVMTSDSDLLAHELAGGKVAFFREIHRNAKEKLSCTTFCPRTIYRKLGLPGSTEPWRLAYERQRSPNATLPQILKDCSSPILDSIDYQEFRQQYLRHENVALPTTRQKTQLSLDSLDPRLSELFLQIGQMSPRSSLDEVSARIFLPILIESPSKGTAWEPSTPIRRLAYTIANWILSSSSPVSVHEYRRVQSRDQKGREVGLLPWNDVSRKADNLLLLMEQLRQRSKGMDTSFWVFFCLASNIMECKKQGKYCHVLQMLQQNNASAFKNDSNIHWDLAHFVAQLQAGYYSLRLLSQTMSLTLNYDLDDLPKSLLQTRDALSELPSLTEFPDTTSAVKLFEMVKNEGRFLKRLEELAIITSTSESEVKRIDNQEKAKKRREKRSEPPRKAPPSSAKNNKDNMFSLLATD